MPELGVRCVRCAASGAGLTDFGKAACVSLLLVLSCVLSPAFAQASEVACPVGSQAMTGSGTGSTPYQVTNICQLQGISSRPAAYYVLMDNIDASTTKDWYGGKGFRPIASTAAGGFSGSFVNPGSFEISSLTIRRSSTDNVGLFSRLASGATIRGVILAGSRTTGRNRVGLLVGYSDGVIEDCTATGSVSGVNTVGGLVGENQATISDSYATGSVFGVNTVGGLVGENQATISDSYATGPVFGAGDNIGGLVGRSGGHISGSYATGSVFGTGREIGGLVGRSGGYISGSYATGLVFGDVGSIGGLVGRSGGYISGSYATGLVFGDGGSIGGLVGVSSRSSISNSYAAGSVSGNQNVGGLVGVNSFSEIRQLRGWFGFRESKCWRPCWSK